jgi:hypothetical protein
MTYEELLEKVSPQMQWIEEHPSWDALKAVVELHKPWAMETGPEGDSETETVMGCECVPELPAFLNPWPCKTIQAIEKVLSNG